MKNLEVPYTKVGQIKIGDKLLITDHDGERQVTCEDIAFDKPGDPEIIINSKKNYYFISSKYFEGTSWVKNCVILKSKEKQERFRR